MDLLASSVSPSSGVTAVHGTCDLDVVQHPRFTFRSRVQGDQESAGGYAQALRTLGIKCGYRSSVLEEQIREQFIFGLKGKATQDSLYARDDSVTLAEVISIAVAAEKFQKGRFGHQHPLFKEEIHHALGPYLDESSLLRMRLVSQECKRHVDVELCRRQAQVSREFRWDPSSCLHVKAHKGFILKFSRACQVNEFIEMFGEQDEGISTRWPFFGEGIVHFESRFTNAESVIKFLKTFGAQVRMLIWWNDDESTPFSEFATALLLTPNLRTLWISWKAKLPVVRMTSGVKEKKLPKLPYLDSLYSAFHNKSLWMSYVLFNAYGSQLTALNLNHAVHMPALIQQFSSYQSFLLPLNNVQELTVHGYLKDVHQLGAYTDWNLRKLSTSVGTFASFSEDSKTFTSLADYVKKSDVVWSLISQSHQSLEEVYFNNCFEDWKDFIQFYLLPVFHNPAYKSMCCLKVKKLSLPFMFLMRAGKVFDMICTKFPNVEQIQFTRFEACPLDYHKDFVKRNHKSKILLEGARNLFFQETDYNFPIPWKQLSEEVFAQLWKKLGSLRKIIVFGGVERGSEKMKVLFKQIRNSKDQEITSFTK